MLLVILLFQFLACQSSAEKQRKVIDVASKAATTRQGEVFSVGALAPNFKYKDISGKEVSLADFRGKTVLLNFWATWCVPCVVEMPALERLYKTYKEQKFEVVAINVDPPKSLEKVKQFVSNQGLTFPMLLDPDLSLPPQYGLTGFPESFFVDPSGRFMALLDPQTKKTELRILGDKPWDAPSYISAVGELLRKSE